MLTRWVYSRELGLESSFLLMGILDSYSETPDNSSRGMGTISKAIYCRVEDIDVFIPVA